MKIESTCKKCQKIRKITKRTAWGIKKGYSKDMCLSCALKERKFINEKNPSWKGNNAKGKALHKWVKVRKPKIILCEECNKKKKLELANIKNHQYTRNINDYKWLCRSCHNKMDRRIK